jgi:hypothetical protein
MTESDYSWVSYKERAVEIKRKTAPPFDEWEAVMASLNLLFESGGFHRGDLYLKGLEWYGEDRASSIFEPELWSIKTFQNNASVCQRIPPERRRDGPCATYSHHAEVCYVQPDWFDTGKHPELKGKDAEALQDHYLQLAIDNQLSVTKLRAKIKFDRGEGSDPLGDSVEFQKGTALQRLEKLSNKMENIIEDLPEDWDAEARYLESARHQIELAIESGRNRMIGKPAEVQPEQIELTQEVNA